MDKYSNKQLINETTRLGFQFYKRIRLREYQVQVTAQQNITEYPGLLVVSKENAIRYKKISQESSTNTNWERILHKSIELTLLDLIIKGVVELSVFIDKKSYFGGLVKREYIGFYLTASKVYSGKDYLSHCIVKSVKVIEMRHPHRKNLSLFLTHLFDKQIKKELLYENPQREILALFLNGYGEDAPLSFQNHSRFLGEYSQFEVAFTQKQKAELKATYDSLVKAYKMLREDSQYFTDYSRKLRRLIRAECHSRTLQKFD